MDILANLTEAVRARSECSASREPWGQILASAYRGPRELAETLQLPQTWVAETLAEVPEFPLFAPQPFVSRIEPGNVDDPLLRQIWPHREEQANPPGFSLDPLHEVEFRRQPGVLQKYHGRALLITTGVCGVHCRYCFRRHWSYSESPVTSRQWDEALASLAQDDSLREVILSGGDPLTWPDQKLERLRRSLEQIPHLRRLRIHSRMPVVIPQRVTDSLIPALSSQSLQTVMVIHSNHSRELDGAVAQACQRMADAGWLMLNQAVLLAGVNDHVDTLCELSERLSECRVMPYYLHQLDRVAGAGHFLVPVAVGLRLIDQIRGRLPGYLVPRYVVERPGEACKTPLVD